MDMIKGAIEAMFFERGLGEFSLEAQRKQFQDFLSNGQTQFREFGERLTGSEQQHGDLSAQLSKALAEFQTRGTGQIAAHDAAVVSALEKAKQELETIKKTYDEFLALQAPVAYWRTVAKEHGKTKCRFGLFALASGLIGGAVILLTIWVFFPSELPEGASEISKNWQLFRSSATLLIEATATIWITRLFVRVYLSSLHLETDAHERIVMTETYLALLRSEQAFTEAERSIILNQLFRHAATGVVKDDSAPPHPIEVLTRPAEKEK